MRAISSNYAVARAEHYIEQHFSENLTVKQLAELGNLSVSSFNRIFKKETNLTPIEYLIEIRIEKSKKLLRRKEIPITEIAMRCGFNSSSHFSSSFSRLFHITPSEYRNSYCE
jgi:AraC family transcriptional regulator